MISDSAPQSSCCTTKIILSVNSRWTSLQEKQKNPVENKGDTESQHTHTHTRTHTHTHTHEKDKTETETENMTRDQDPDNVTKTDICVSVDKSPVKISSGRIVMKTIMYRDD